MHFNVTCKKKLKIDLDKNITSITYNKSNFFYGFINYYPPVDGNSAFDDYYYPFLTKNKCEKYKSLYIKIDDWPQNCTKINLIINWWKPLKKNSVLKLN